MAFIPTRYLGQQGISPFFELLFRYTFPVVIFGIIYRKQILSTPKTIIKKCIQTGMVLCTALIFSIYGIRLTEYGSIGVLLLSLNVVFVPLYFIFVKKQRISPILLISAFLSFGGSAILTVPTINNPFNSGALLCLFASIGYSAYIILCSKTLNTDISPIVLQFYQSLVFIIVCIPIVIIFDLPTINQINWANSLLYGAILFIGLGAGTIGYQLFFHGQRLSSPTTTALILSSQIMFSIFADFIIFNIELNSLQKFAYGLIFVAVFSVPFQDRWALKFPIRKSDKG